jgi:hypothetical protein
MNRGIALLASFRFILHKLLKESRFLPKKVLPEEHRDARDTAARGHPSTENRAPAEAPAAPPDLKSPARKGHSPHPLVEGARIIGVRLLDSHGDERLKVRSGEETVIEVIIECSRPLSNPVIGLRIQRSAGEHRTVMYDTNTLWRNQTTGEFSQGDVIVARFRQRMSLGPGRYTITVAIASHDAREFYDWQEEIVCFEVDAYAGMQGIVNLDSEIEIGR